MEIGKNTIAKIQIGRLQNGKYTSGNTHRKIQVGRVQHGTY